MDNNYYITMSNSKMAMIEWGTFMYNLGVSKGIRSNTNDIKRLMGTRQIISSKCIDIINETQIAWQKHFLRHAFKKGIEMVGFSADLWSDKYKLSSVLGISAKVWVPERHS